jgi:hypothetical protein
MRVLQTLALPLGHVAMNTQILSKEQSFRKVNQACVSMLTFPVTICV